MAQTYSIEFKEEACKREQPVQLSLFDMEVL